MTAFASRVLRWYSRHGRQLPWRRLRDPYAIWISEVMLQQTRVETAVPYFEKWMLRFPSVKTLAAASEHTVLKHWEGLGYYSRARNLRRAAQLIMREHNGKIPANVAALRRLPGVGAYTAAAVASIAFGQNEPALDSNIRRVLARVFDIRAPVGTSRSEQRTRDLAHQHMPRARGADFNQGLMDLGATICLPSKPLCVSCPVGDLCAANRAGRQAQLPVQARKKNQRRIRMAAMVISRQGRVLLGRRPSRGLLGGMWEFPKAPVSGKLVDRIRIRKHLPVVIRDTLHLQVRDLEPFMHVEHAYSHFEVLVEAFRCSTGSRSAPAGLRWASVQRLSTYPMGKVDRTIADRLQANQKMVQRAHGGANQPKER